MDYNSFLMGAYRDQLGREPDQGGLQFYIDQLTKGAKTQEQIIAELNQSLEGQNYDTQVLTSGYRSLFGRNPEQEGYQYWMSRVQTDPAISAAVVNDYLRGGAAGTDIVAAQSPQTFDAMMVSALEADPFGGRRATQDIYNVPSDAANISMMGQQQVAFVNPVTQAPIISTFDPVTGTYTFTEGNRTLSPGRVAEAISIARGSGALSGVEADGLMNQLQFATPENIYDTLAAPQAGVVIDPRFGMQLGEDANMATARAEAAERATVLAAMDQSYAPAYDQFGNQLVAAGQQNPFAPGNYAAPTMVRQGDITTPQNFGQQLGQTINQSFAGSNFLGAPVTPGFYSERGFEPTYVPFAAGQPQFRSGVAGYAQNIPQGFQFGMPGVVSSFNQFMPGPFDRGIIDSEGNWKPTPSPAQAAYDETQNIDSSEYDG
jgi:hypothetical protein